MERLKTTKKNTRKSAPILDVESNQESNSLDNITRIAISAYYKSEARGYEPGHELQDWLEAEAEVPND
jgi:hypothetical protein